MKLLINFLAISMVITSLASCGKDDSVPPPVPNPVLTFNATLSGAAEVPSNASSATGTATLLFDTITKIFVLKVTYSGLTSSAGHIHKAAAGASGGVVFPFPSFTSPVDYTSVALTAQQEADLRANLYYVNIHSSAFAAGEIRGQLLKQ